MGLLRKKITEMHPEELSREHIIEREHEIRQNARTIFKNRQLARRIIELGIEDTGFANDGVKELVRRDANKGGEIIAQLDEKKLGIIAKELHTSYLQKLNDNTKAKIAQILMESGDIVKAVKIIQSITDLHAKTKLLEKILNSEHIRNKKILETLVEDPDATILIFRKEKHADFDPELMEIVEQAFQRYSPRQRRAVIAHLLEFDMKNEDAIRKSLGILLRYMRGTGTDPENLRILEQTLEKLERIALEKKEGIGKELLARGGPEAMRAALTLIKAKQGASDVKEWARKGLWILEEALENVTPEMLKRYGIDPKTYYTTMFQIATNILDNEKIHDLGWMDKVRLHEHVKEVIEHMRRNKEIHKHVMEQTLSRFARSVESALENGKIYVQRMLYHLAQVNPNAGRSIAVTYLGKHPQPKTAVNELHAAFYGFIMAENPGIRPDEAAKRAKELVQGIVKRKDFLPKGLESMGSK